MPFSLPYSRKRRYLTGVDWIIGTLDAMTQRSTGAGNSSQIILELEGQLDSTQFRELITRFTAQFPALSGYPARDWLNLAPFWKMDQPEGSCVVKIWPEQTETNAALSLLCEAINTPFPSRWDHLAFHLVHVGSEKSLLGMIFDHRLFDARGAELFLDQLAAFAAGTLPPVPTERTHPTRQPYLSHWENQFRAGRVVNQAILKCASVKAAQFPLPRASGHQPFRYQFGKLDEAENRQITEQAYELGGYLVKLPYLLALAIEAVDHLFAKRGLAPEHYVVPVSIDRRAAHADNQTLFFNHVSFIHFRIARDQMKSRETLVQTITAQMYEQTKTRLPEEFEQAAMLMRILPVGLLAALSVRLFGGNFGSFIFSSLGESAVRSRRFMDHPIINLFHTPRVATPPGIGIFINEFAGKMNITAAAVGDLITEAESRNLVAHFQPDHD